MKTRSGLPGSTRHSGKSGEEDTRGEAVDGMRRGVRKQEKDLDGEVDKN